MINEVLEFRRKLGLPIGDEPQLLSPQQISFYTRFILEELSELLRAHEHGNLVDAADAIGDLLYIAIGCGLHMGIPLGDIFDIIHKANMTKLPGTTKRGGLVQDAKKPADWQGPEAAIAKVLNAKHRKSNAR